MDKERRELERLAKQGDEQAQAKLIALKVKTGELSRRRVIYAARLGHKIAIMLEPDQGEYDSKTAFIDITDALHMLAREHPKGPKGDNEQLDIFYEIGYKCYRLWQAAGLEHEYPLFMMNRMVVNRNAFFEYKSRYRLEEFLHNLRFDGDQNHPRYKDASHLQAEVISKILLGL